MQFEEQREKRRKKSEYGLTETRTLLSAPTIRSSGRRGKREREQNNIQRKNGKSQILFKQNSDLPIQEAQQIPNRITAKRVPLRPWSK